MNNNLLAARYAQAVCVALGDRMTPEVAAQIAQYAHFIAEHRATLFYLKVSSIPAEKKCAVLEREAEKFGVGKTLAPLFKLLAQHRRLYMIESVLGQIGTVYRALHNIIECTCKSAMPLDEAARVRVENALAKKFDATVRVNYGVDPQLIAGMRIANDEFLWEHSVRGYLRTLQQSRGDVTWN